MTPSRLDAPSSTPDAPTQARPKTPAEGGGAPQARPAATDTAGAVPWPKAKTPHTAHRAYNRHAIGRLYTPRRQADGLDENTRPQPTAARQKHPAAGGDQDSLEHRNSSVPIPAARRTLMYRRQAVQHSPPPGGRTEALCQQPPATCRQADVSPAARRMPGPPGLLKQLLARENTATLHGPRPRCAQESSAKCDRPQCQHNTHSRMHAPLIRLSFNCFIWLN